MATYLTRRALQALLVLWGAFTVSFLLLYALPSDAISIKLSGAGETSLSREALDAIRADLGYDDPLVVQYLRQLGKIVTGDAGVSLYTGTPVVSMITSALPYTVGISLLALVIGSVAGLVLGSLAAHSRSARLREALLSLPPLGISVPTFAVGLVLIQVVAFRWRLLPSGGSQGFDTMILPAITLALPVMATVTQIFAKSLREVLHQGYIDTATSKGVSRLRLHLRHGVRNAIGPSLTMAAIIVGSLLGGAVITETVFSREGIGRITVDAVTRQDLPVVQGVVLLSALVFVVVNLLVDLTYPLLDRRVVLAKESR